MADLPVLTPSQLHRLVPSALAKMERRLRLPEGVRTIRKAFEDYLALLNDPRAVELDDVTRIALQLNSIGFWKKIRPEVFINGIRSRVDGDVLVELRRVLKVNSENQTRMPLTFYEETAGPRVMSADLRVVTPPSVTMKHLAAALAETHDMSKKRVETVLGDLVGNIVKHLRKGERIRIGGLGVLQVRKSAARVRRNPATGEQFRIRPNKDVAFRASKELKEKI
jgi:DNA-binding protein HU-beta